MKTKLLIMLLSCICMTAVASEPQDSIQSSKQRQSVPRKSGKEKLYDINGDGVVNIVDVTVLIDYILYGDKEEKSNKECPDENHPHWIDLGIGTLWSCCNEGASRPEEYGGYYQFGVVASAPSLEQIKMLLDNTKSEWTTLNGVTGRKFTGPNGGTIFLPAPGRYMDGVSYFVDTNGYYWSSSHYSGNYAYNLNFDSWRADLVNGYCGYGMSVRPVK